ncbi:MAG: hypothetical protein J0H98_04880 [Solirubrobacterales bacterium]|nr:hypothetical protein [Solirubrobacterales bacterium]
MNRQGSAVSLRRIAAFGLAFAMALALVAAATGQAEAGKKKRKAKVAKVAVAKVVTKNQQQLLSQKKLTVKVRSSAKTTARLAVTHAGKKKYFKGATVRFRKKGVKTVRISLTAAGRTQLGKCGAKAVKVTATYKKGKRKAKAVKGKTLAKWAANKSCIKYVTVPLGSDPEHCDFLDQTVCLQPFPNDYYTTKDDSSPTGRRLNLGAESTPMNSGNSSPTHMDVTDINRGDGFSPGNLITIKIPGLDTPAAFENSKLVPLNDIERYKDADQAVVVIDADTGQRWPIWAELDSNPTTVDPTDDSPGGIGLNPGNTGPVNLLIRPAQNFQFGHRYIVAFRNLRDADDQPIDPPLGFQVYRDDLPTKQPIVENRRAHMDEIIDSLGSAGIDRSSLYMAWDFTIASQQSVTGRATTIRDDAFKRLGDENLSDGLIAGNSPDVDVLAWCDADNPGAATCGDNYPGRAQPDDFNPALPITSPVPDSGVKRTVVGYIRNVPCYLDQNSCPTGSKFAFDGNGKLTWNASYKMDVPFRCMIPMSTVAGGTLHPGGTGTYGHGLLGTLSQVRTTVEAGNRTNSSWCATNWDGFSDLDLPTVAAALMNMSNFPKAVDRMQQGFVNFLYLQRALVHPDGFADTAGFTIDPDGAGPNPAGSVIDTSAGNETRGYYYGISQGGIMGGALTALSPDIDRAVLGVPGINYSTLLRRSVDSDEYFRLPVVGLYANYPDLASRPVLLSLMQLLWDRGEGNGYAHNMNDDPLENTNQHEVLLQLALGDHQVTNYAAEVEARTIGALRYSPTLQPARTWDLDYVGLPSTTTFPSGPGESFMVYYDGGPAGYNGANGEGSALPPLENVPPRPEWGYGGDPHGYPRSSTDGNDQLESFLENGTIDQCSGSGGYCYSNGWDGSTGL